MSNKSFAVPIFVGGFFFFIIVTAAGVVFVISEKNKTINTTLINSIATTNSTINSNVPSTVSLPVSAAISNTVTDQASIYKDGTYTVDASYLAPEEEFAPMKVSITLSNDLITSVRVVPEASGESERYQTRFANVISTYVVGKNIESAKLAKVISGASLTTDAFNQALAKIQSQAM